NLIEKENKFVFVVDKNANKQEIKKEIEELYNLEVTSVKTLISMKGEKREFVKLKKKNAASELATKLNLI
ncbi:50S ribosomal protein L23, partial [archaeon]|nr:50S ribosomal protein L23 [archaeon]